MDATVVKFILMLLLLGMITLRILLQMSVVPKRKLDSRLKVILGFWETGTTRIATPLKQNLYVLHFQQSFKKVASFSVSGDGLEEILSLNIK